MFKRANELCDNPLCLEIEIGNKRLGLTTSRLGAADVVRRKLLAFGLFESDINDAVAWARSSK